MHVLLLDTSVSQALLHEAHGITEVVHAKLLEACSRQRARVVDALAKRVNLNSSCVEEERVLLASSNWVRNRRITRWLPAKSLPRFSRLESYMRQSTRRLSKSSLQGACRLQWPLPQKMPSSMVSRTRRRYLLPYRRSGHCAPHCLLCPGHMHCSCCEFVNDAHHVEPCNRSRLLGGLTLGSLK